MHAYLLVLMFARVLCVLVLAPYCQKCPTDMMLEPFVHYVVNTNYARQVEFTER